MSWEDIELSDIKKLHGRNLTAVQKRTLTLIRKRVLFENFGAGFQSAPATIKNTKEATEYIRKHTRLYMESWVLSLLDIMLKEK